MTNSLGLYLHIPFCEKKCRYCDFYSGFATEKLLDSYTAALKREINQWGGKLNRPIDTIYLGGGTPSLLSFRLKDLLNEIKNSFCVEDNAEITLEFNPSNNFEKLLDFAKEAGINRLSIGAQSGINSELKLLGRTHTRENTKSAFEYARKLGFSNISLDIMLGLPDSDIQTLKTSLDFLTDLNPEHISAYILKVEENTFFYKNKDSLNLPLDDEISEQYLYMCDYLFKKGYNHYEISNFSKENFESRHNLKYWQGNDYLGLGPSAHSALCGKRFFYPRDTKAYINGNLPTPDGKSGGKEEYIMLRLRLKDGINLKEYRTYFSESFSENIIDKCRTLEKFGLMNVNHDSISLTNKGMLVSNSIITEILEYL